MSNTKRTAKNQSSKDILISNCAYMGGSHQGISGRYSNVQKKFLVKIFPENNIILMGVGVRGGGVDV